MNDITWQRAEEILGGRVDRRKRYYHETDSEFIEMFGGATVYNYGEFTRPCTGCSEAYMGQYSLGSEKGGIGCHECGYTGRRRDGIFYQAELLESKEATRAYVVKTKGHDMQSVVRTRSPARAKYLVWRSARHAGYHPSFGDLGVKRASEYDGVKELLVGCVFSLSHARICLANQS